MKDFRNDKIIQDLIVRIKNKKIIPFIGAGLSYNLGLPSWKDLVDSIAEKVSQVSHINRKQIKNEIRERRDLLETIEYLMIKSNISKKEILSDIINEPIDKTIISKNHEYLASLGLPIIYTTNWDDIIEITYKRLDIPYFSIESAEDFLNINPDVTTIFKFHGSLKYPETLVLTESDYYERFGIDSPFDIRFRSDLLEKSILFLGTSLSDYNIRYIWNRTQKNQLNKLGTSLPASYYVSVSRDDVKETILEYNNIKTINLEEPDNFVKFMEYLSQEINK